MRKNKPIFAKMGSMSKKFWMSACLLGALCSSAGFCAESAKIQFQLGSRAYREGRKDAALQEYRYFLKRFPDHEKAAQAQFMIGEIFFTQKKYAQAADCYMKVAGLPGSQNWTDPAAYRLGECYHNMGDFEEAGAYFKKVMHSSRSTLQGEAAYGMAMTELASRRYDEAENTLLDLMSNHPAYEHEPKVLIALGLISLDKDNLKSALQHFERGGDDPGCVYFQGVCALRSDEILKATEAFQKVIRLAPDSVWAAKASYQKGECFYALKQFDLAKASFEQLYASGSSELKPFALYRLACVDYRQKKTQAAEEKWNRLIRDYPESELVPGANMLLADVHLLQGRTAKAMSELETLLSVDALAMDAAYKMVWANAQENQYDQALGGSKKFLDQYSWGLLAAKMQLIQGFCLQGLGQQQKAMKVYQTILDNTPSFPALEQVLYLLTRTYFEAGAYDRILTHAYPLSKQILKSPNEWQAEITYWTGRSYEKVGQYAESRRILEAFAQRFPKSPLLPYVHQGITAAALGQGDPDGALESETAALTLALQNEVTVVAKSALLNIGHMHFNREEYLKASAVYDQFLSRYPNDVMAPQALYQNGLALYRSEAYAKAARKWEELITRFPNNTLGPEALLQVAKTHFGLGDYLAAMTSFNLLIQKYPSSDLVPEAQFQVGQSYFNQGNLPAAVSQFKEFLKRYSENARATDARGMLETCYYRMGKESNNFDLLMREFPSSPLVADVYWELGSQAFGKKDYAQARLQFQKILLNFSSTSLANKAFFYQAECYYFQDQLDQAAPGYERFVRDFPTDPLAKSALFRLAVCRFKLEQYDQSVELFNEFLTTYPADPLARDAAANLPLCYLKLDRSKEAFDAFSRFLALYPKDPQVPSVHFQIGSLLEAQNDCRQAVLHYQKAQASGPDRIAALFQEGRCQEKLHMTAAQRQAYEQLTVQAPASDPRRMAALGWLASFYEESGQTAKSVASLKQIVQYSSDPEVVRIAQEKIKQLKGNKL